MGRHSTDLGLDGLVHAFELFLERFSQRRDLGPKMLQLLEFCQLWLRGVFLRHPRTTEADRKLGRNTRVGQIRFLGGRRRFVT